MPSEVTLLLVSCWPYRRLRRAKPRLCPVLVGGTVELKVGDESFDHRGGVCEVQMNIFWLLELAGGRSVSNDLNSQYSS